MDDRALSRIRLCLADDVLFNIVSEKTAAGLWSKLEKLYMTKSLTNRILLKQQLYSLRMKEEDKAITLLCSLPESWDHFVTSISFNTSDILEFDDVVGALLAEETRKRSNADTSTSEVMMARGRSRERHSGGKHSDSRSKSKGKKLKVKC
eukprot:PITA_18222